MFRQDLLEAGIGDGCHGFSIDVGGLADDLTGMIIRRADTGEMISQHPFRILTATQSRGDVAGRWVCVVDYVDGGVVVGWAIDQHVPQAPVALVVRTETGEVSTGLADLYREDLAALGNGTGRHGFRIALSNPNYRGTITVHVASSGTSLTEQPINTDPDKALLAERVSPALRGVMQMIALEIDMRAGSFPGAQAR